MSETADREQAIRACGGLLVGTGAVDPSYT
jgi:mannitol/fructose-specific phosphotransferase system IIA component